MPEESKSEPSSQAVEYLKLFQQVGRSFVGLFLLEIGWTLVLVLATKLVGEEHGPPSIGKLPFTQIWLYGAVIVAISWGIYSRLISYALAPVLIISKIIFDILFIAVAIIFGIMDSCLRPIVRPLRRARIRRRLTLDKKTWIAKNVKAASDGVRPSGEARYEEWLSKLKATIGADMRVDKSEWLRKYKEEHRSDKELPGAESAFVSWETTARREYADRMLESIAAEKVWLQEENLARLVQLIGQHFLTPLHSTVTVGVAPLIRYSHGQELVFERAPLQQFGSSIAAARARLSSLKGLKYITVHPLPSLFRIETDARARFARWFFQLDTLVWGRYLQDDEELAQIYLVTAEIDRVEDGVVGLPHQWRIFPRSIDSKMFSNSSAFTFAPTNPFDGHVVMCLAVLRGLIRRHDKGAAKFLVGWDQAYFSSSSDMRRLLVHLAFEILPLAPERVAKQQVLPTAATALADVVSQWVGYQLGNSFSFDEEDKWISDQQETYAPQLHHTVSKCAKLLPNAAEHYYRLGALSCVIGKQERAFEEFRHAAVLDRKSERVRPIPAGVLARDALHEAEGVSADEELALTRFAAHAACAIHLGGSAQIQRDMEESTILVLRKAHPTIALVQKLLADPAVPGLSVS
jgi:hypothetical protein